VIERIDDLAGDVIGIRAVGDFTIEDYRALVEPELERVDADGTDLRLLLHLGEEFTGFGEGAWGQLTDEIRQTRFHRGAVVTDDRMIRTGLSVLKWTLRGQVRTFRNAQYEDAVAWVAS
jgi:hypothetical protein